MNSWTFPWTVHPRGWAIILILAAAPWPLNAQVVINEILAANRLVNTDEDQDPSDWVELYNAGAADVDLAGFGLSDNRSSPLKWLFPETVVPPGGYLLVWCSGKDRIDVTPERIIEVNSPIPFDPVLFDSDAAWSYLTGPPEDAPPPAGWNLAGFDDSAWSVGQPGFGWGDDDDRTVLDQGIGAVFLRHAFQHDPAKKIRRLIFQVRYDDGIVIYLNGVKVISAGFPPDQEPKFSSLANRAHEARLDSRFDLTPFLDLLKPGENLIAAVVLNVSATSNDLSFIPELGTVPSVLHANFKLGNAGDSVVLSYPDGRQADSVTFSTQTEDRSFARSPNGSGDFLYHLRPTPLKPNDGPTSTWPISSQPDIDPLGGEFAAPVAVTLSVNLPVDPVELRYTLDGSKPAASSPLYSSPITISRSMVVRAAAFSGGEMVTQISTMSYFINAQSYELPIFSIAMSPQDFAFVHTTNDGRGIQYEREGYVEAIQADGVRAAGAGMGLRLHGGAGRNGDMSIKKAYKMYFRSEYGDKRLRYQLIPDTEVANFDRLVLRSNFNDAFRTGGQAALIRDQVIRDLHEDMGAVVSHGGWYNLFVNMQYRGVYNIVERMDKAFFASYFPEDGENWDVIKTGDSLLDGDSLEWNRLRQFLATNILTKEAAFEEISRMVDIENYTGYMILNIWAQNHDWPHNNWYAARPRRPDGKWIFLSWDAEFGLGRNPSGYQSDTLSHVFSRSGGMIANLLIALLRNTGYQKYFLEEFRRHLDGALSPQNALARIRRQRDIIAPDMLEETRLVGQSVPVWDNNVRSVEVFAQNRGAVIWNLLMNSPLLTLPRALVAAPKRVSPEGEVEIAIRGQGFAAGTEVFFNDVPSPQVTVESLLSIKAILPFDLGVGGSPDITLSHPVRGKYVSKGLLEVAFPVPEPVAITPETGAVEGGDVIFITGKNFTEGVRVEFGGVQAASVTRPGGGQETLRVITPPGTGSVPVQVINTRPGELPAAAPLTFTYVDSAPFRRGDADGNGAVDMTDAVFVLAHLFLGETTPACWKSADADASDAIDVSDPVYLLVHLFQGGAPPPEPFSACGREAEPGKLGCGSYTACR